MGGRSKHFPQLRRGAAFDNRMVPDPSINPVMRNPQMPKRKSTAPKKHKRGVVVLQEIRRYQASTEMLIQKAPFSREAARAMIKVTEGTEMSDARIQPAAISMLQAASEDLIVSVFEDVNMLARHANRTTIMLKDIKLAMKMRGGPHFKWLP